MVGRSQKIARRPTVRDFGTIARQKLSQVPYIILYMAISYLFHVETPGCWTYVCMGSGLASEILTFGLAAEKYDSPIRS